MEKTLEIPKTEGARLKLVIEKYLRLTQVQFAKKIGIPPQTIHSYTNGTRVLGMRNLLKITDTFPRVNEMFIKKGELPVLSDEAFKEQTMMDKFNRFSEELAKVNQRIEDLTNAISKKEEKEMIFLRLLDSKN